MAYAAAIYLLGVLKQLQQSDQFSCAHYPKSKIHDLQGKICSLKDFLEKKSSLEDNSESTIHLESRIRDAIYEAEDTVEHHISTHFTEETDVPILCRDLQKTMQEDIDSGAEEEDSSESASSGEENDTPVSCRDLQKVIQDIDSVAEEAEKLTVQAGEDSTGASWPANRGSLRSLPARGEDIIVGRYEDINHLVGQLRESSRRLEVVPIVGIPGIGKTALARAVYDDQLIESYFGIRAWVKISPEYNKRDILLGLLRSMGALGVGKREETDDQLEKYLYDLLESNKYLIVLDDICDVEAWSILKHLLPDSNNGSRVILTTRYTKIASFADNNRRPHEVGLLSEDETWNLLQEIVFFDELCPPQLEQIAKNIAKDCRGLPLAIVIVGRVLTRASIAGWQTVASSISACKGHDKLVEVVLSLTYRSLPQYFKACLLYMGIFPRNYEIPVSKLIKLWIAEGFLELNGSQTIENLAEEVLLELENRSLVSVCQHSSCGRIKTCMIDDVFREFIKGKAKEDKFFHVINKDANGFLEDAHSQRRFCILKNIRFGTRDVDYYNKKARVSTARSLLYNGPVHQHPLRAWLDFKLLRVLDALNIRFYSFPPGVLKLVQLRYLALTYNGELPASVCKLWNLQYLIVLRNLSTKYSGDHLHLPMEIWNMKELRHLQFMGRDLPDPSTAVSVLSNLLTLSDVSSHSCTPGVLQRIPNLKKLGIRIESPALDAAEDFSFLSHLHILNHLESLKCVVVRPDFGSQVVSSVPAFPPSLRKLCLSGCGFSWKFIKVISNLQNLEVLKLQNYSFRGPKWKLNKEEFIRLRYLLLEDMDVAKWMASSANFPSLAHLIIRHCYKLQKIPYGIGEIPTLEMIEVDGCNPSVVNSVLEIRKLQQEDFGNYGLQVRIPSWNNPKFKTFRP